MPPEHEGLRKALNEIVGDITKRESPREHLLEDCPPVQRVRQAEVKLCDDAAAKNSDEVVDYREEGQHDQAREHARRDQFLDRICSERIQSVYLLSHPHRSKLGGDAGADSSCNHQPRQHRTKLAYHRPRDHLADQSLLPQRLKLNGHLEGEHHPGEKAGEEDYTQGSHTDHVHLLKEVRRIERLDENEANRLSGQREELLQGLDAALCRVVEAI